MSLIDTRRAQMFPAPTPAQVAAARRFASDAPRRFATGETLFDVGEAAAPVAGAGRIDRRRPPRRAVS